MGNSPLVLRNLRRRFLISSTFATGLLAAGGAQAASPSDLCIRDRAAPAVSTEELRRVTVGVEALLATRNADQAELALDRLQLGDAPAAEPADPTAVAAYCAAAGEAMRVSRSGGQGLAQEYLLAAIQLSEQTSARPVSHQAAYRLALASISAPASGNLRSARSAFRAANLAPPGATLAVAASAEGSGPCAILLEPEYLERSSWRGAQTALECAGDRARAVGDHATAALALHRIARLNLAAAERNPAAADDLRRVAGAAALAGLPDALRVAQPALRRALLALLVEAAIDGGRAGDPALRSGLAALAAAGGDPSDQAVVAALSGRVALAAGETGQAAAALRRAVFLEGQSSRPVRMADWLLLLAQADPANRASHVLQAYRALEIVRPILPAADPLTEESNFALRMRPVFEAAVEVQLGDGIGNAAGDGATRIASAQQIIETFRQAEIQSAFGNDCVPPGRPIEPAELQAGEILLYPILLRDRVELIYARRVDGEAPRYERIAGGRVGRDTIARLVSEMSFSIAYGDDDSWRGPAQELYRLLIAPIEPLLGADATLVIVPDGPLRALPFAALLDGTDHFLIERARISLAPALAYAQPGIRHDDPPITVAASVEEDVALRSGFFPALAGARDEARAAAGTQHGVLIENFRREDLRRALSRGHADILHLATHAAFNGRSDRSFIVAAGEAIPMGDLRTLLAAGRTRGDQLDMIILSACETAVGDDHASMGLAGASVQAGARSALASLWRVSDAGTAELMRQFYSFYRAGQGRAEALRNAQLALIGQSGAMADPNSWSAFALLGSWR